MLSTNQIFGLVIIGIIIIGYFVWNYYGNNNYGSNYYGNNPEGFESQMSNASNAEYIQNENPGIDVSELVNQRITNIMEPSTLKNQGFNIPTMPNIDWKNKGVKDISCATGVRGNSTSAINAPVETIDTAASTLASSLDFNKMASNMDYKGHNMSNPMYSSYKNTPKEYTVNDLYNVNKLLPQETNKNWFDSVPSPLNVKNQNLINISRPIGVDTVGSSLRNACLDIRGNIPIPKLVVSPWLQSTIEPDFNTIGLCSTS